MATSPQENCRVSTIIAIRHVAFEDLGSFESVLRGRGHDIRYVEASMEDFSALPVTATEPLFILGGPIGAYEEALYPFLNAELAFIAKRLAAKLPTFGICLGAQLMARALGARVYPAKAKELGWAPVSLTEAGRASALRALGDGPVLHWHGDTFDLPDGATRLASTALCENQAFSFGKHAIALQFHVEADARGLERWYVGHTMELAAAKIAVPTLRAASQAFAPAAAARGTACLTAWLDAL
jgi:GMP synthase (glutamine-hydrolysing)